jgi:glycosyltransferase involved in cell wall biosynthesis
VHQNLLLGLKDKLFRKRTLAALKHCDCIIAVSEYLRNIIAAEGLGRKTHIIPCGFNKNIIPTLSENETRTKLSLPAGKKLLLFAGNLEPVKGADILISAFEMVYKKNCNVELILIGDGSKRKLLEQQVDVCGVAEAVRFLGRKSNQETLLYINAADIVVVPSRNEGRSVVIFEALACGKPVVASNVGGIPETIIDEKLGILVEKENPAALAEGINRAFIQPCDKKYLSKYALKYTSDRMASEVSRVYDEVLDLG